MDSGSSFSLLPHHSTEVPSGPLLRTADGTPLPTWGVRTTTVRFGSHTFSFDFLLAPVSLPILGTDFLSHHHLLIDPRRCQVLLSSSLHPLLPPATAATSPLLASLQSCPPAIRSLLDRYPTVFSSEISSSHPAHGVQHHIPTAGPPVFAKARRLDQDRLHQAQADFAKLEAAGIIRRSSSPWASPLHLVPKPDGSWRPCGDYRRLNLQTVPDRYPLPNLHDLSARLHGSTVFSKLDLVKGYYQVPVAAADVPKTAIITPFGLFEFTKMPFGLRNAAQTFQRPMDHLLCGLPFVFVYLDDILVASPDLSTHLSHQAAVLDILQANGLLGGQSCQVRFRPAHLCRHP